jgi:hypothetical protein
LPTAKEVEEAERALAIRFHPDYRRFQLEVGNITSGVLEPAVVLPDISPYLDLRKTARDAWRLGVPKDVLPFCHDNGNYYFIDQDGVVGFWDHDDESETRGGALADWIVEEWLGQDMG